MNQKISQLHKSPPHPPQINLFMHSRATIFAIWLGSLISCFGGAYSPGVVAPEFRTNTVSLLDCGGIPDGATLNTGAFAKAIKALAEAGGGKLVVPPGIWLTGPIKLRSRINLRLERGALIQFSGDYQLYPLTVIDTKGEKEVDSISPIFGENLENVAVTGEGVIDGGGDAWRLIKKAKLTDGEWKALVKSGGVLDEKGTAWWPSAAAMNGEKVVAQLRKSGSLKPEDYEPAHQFLRPKMLRLIGCKKVLIEGVTFQNNVICCDALGGTERNEPPTKFTFRGNAAVWLGSNSAPNADKSASILTSGGGRAFAGLQQAGIKVLATGLPEITPASPAANYLRRN